MKEPISVVINCLFFVLYVQKFLLSYLLHMFHCVVPWVGLNLEVYGVGYDTYLPAYSVSKVVLT